MAAPRAAPAASGAPTTNGAANLAAPGGDWTPDEHARFLQALERYGSGSSGQEWALIAKHVGTRSEEATRYHAHAYFMMLQHKPQPGPLEAEAGSAPASAAGTGRKSVASVSTPQASASPGCAGSSTKTPRTSKRKARRKSNSGGKKSPSSAGAGAGTGTGTGAGAGGGSGAAPAAGKKSPKRRRRRRQVALALQHVPSPSALSSPGSSLWGSPTVTLGVGATAWTQEEDSIFENGLALFDEATIGRWDKIASMIPHKTADEVRRRYQLLLLDVAKLEAGAPVTVSYRADRKSRTPRAGSTPPALMTGSPRATARRQSAGQRPSSTRSAGPAQLVSPGSSGSRASMKSPLALLHDAAMARVAQGHAFGLPTASERRREASKTPGGRSRSSRRAAPIKQEATRQASSTSASS